MNGMTLKSMPVMAVAALALCWTQPSAADWPEKPIQVVVPYAPGGGTDIFVRKILQAIEMNEFLDQPIVVINRAGAGGRTGSRSVLNAKPDGYTFLVNHLTLLVGEATGLADFGYRDFEAVAATGRECSVLMVPSESPYQSIGDLIKAAKEKPNTITYGVNIGALNHMAGIELQQTLPGAEFRFVQIGGSSGNLTAVRGSVIDVGGTSAGTFKNGQDATIRPLGVYAKERLEALPEIPTMVEQGYDASMCYDYWWLAPDRTPVEAITGLAAALKKAMSTQEIQEFLAQNAVQPLFQDSAEVSEEMDRQYELIVPLATEAMAQAQK